MFIKLREKNGLTLVEMVVSVLILGLALGVMLGTFVMGRMSATKAKHHIEAMNHARAAMELLKNNLSAASSTEWNDLKNNVSATLPGGNLHDPNISGTGLKTVTVTISWNERQSPPPISEKLVTLISE